MTTRRSGAFPLRFDIQDPEARHFWTDCYLPWINFSHGKLRIFSKMLQIDLLTFVQQVMSDSRSLHNKKTSPTKSTKKKAESSFVTLDECLEAQSNVEIAWDQKFFEHHLLHTPIVSTFGIDFPQANNLVIIKSGAHEEDVSKTSIFHENEAEDFLSYHPSDQAKTRDNHNFYILDVLGFYVSPRRGVKPSIVTSVLRVPSSRSRQETQAWEQWKKQNPKIAQPTKEQVPPQALQVERHACPLRYMYSRFHPSVPFLQDPETDDEHLYTWVGWKAYQKFTDLDLQPSTEKKTMVEIPEHEMGVVKFQLDGNTVPLASYKTAIKGRRKERDLQIFFGVARTWNRLCLLDPKDPDYALTHKFHIHKVKLLELSKPSVPQVYLEKAILYSLNPLCYKNKNSCMRGKTHFDTAIKNWQKE